MGGSIDLGGGGSSSSMFVTAFNTPLHTPYHTVLQKLPHSLSIPSSRFSRARIKNSPTTSQHNALPFPDIGLVDHIDHVTTLHMPSFLNSFGDLLHTTTTTSSALDHITTNTAALHQHHNDIQSTTSMLLSDSSTATATATATAHPPHLPHPHLPNNQEVREMEGKVGLEVREIEGKVGELFREVEEELIEEVKEELSNDSDIVITPEMEKASLNEVGQDLILFLTICVIVAPLSSFLNISPVLLYLAFGLIAGPNGLHLMKGSEDVGFELGDFGILFLLFVEGLNLSPERLRELGSFFSLGATQLLLSVGVIFFGLFLGGPLLFTFVSNPDVPIDPLLIQLLEQPVVAFAIAAAGALSSSAFVLPILKEKGWEDRPDGIAALSILLLQDLAVAPLLVILPLLADVEGVGTGDGGADPIALGILAFKATVVFGGVLALASVALRKVFQVVATSKSSQSFVAASLLVAVGMGVVSDFLGLSATTGAFAAGVLLAESGYRAQIEADIQPFEGILLGVFFITAGSALDPVTVIDCWPTLLAGIISFLLIKFGVIYSAGGALELSKGDAARVGLLLAGGGEFAFVVFNLAKDNGIINDELGSLLTASVIISMALTPLLGEIAEYVGNQFDVVEAEETKEQWFGDDGGIEYDVSVMDEKRIQEAFSRFDKDGNGEITAEELQNIFTLVGERDRQGKFLSLDQVKSIIQRFDDNDDGVLQFEEFSQLWLAKRRSAISEESLRRAVVICGYNEVGQSLCALLDKANIAGIPYVAFARKTEQITASVTDGARVVYGDGTSGALIRAAGVQEPTAIAITYTEPGRCLKATEQLREAFPDSPIFVRSDSNGKVKKLINAGATEVIVATSTVSSGIGQLLGVRGNRRFGGVVEDPSVASAFGSIAMLAPPVEKDKDKLSEIEQKKIDADGDREETRKLFKLFSTSLTLNDDGKAQLSELVNELLRTSDFFVSDKQVIDLMGCESLNEKCLADAEETYVTFSEFVTLYRKNIALGLVEHETE